MIKTQNLTKTYGKGEGKVTALGGVDITIKDGEMVAIIGKSGSGKSTMLRCVNLLEKPTSGQIFFEDTEITAKGTDINKVREHVGMVFQSFNLIDELNVEENVELPLTYLGVPKKERKVRVEEVLRRMAISHRAHHFPQQLSGGQQQRVAIARAVVMNPKLILADEPTGNLDSKNGLEVMQLLTQLNQEGTTVLMVTHSERDAGYAQRIINLLDGQVVPEVSL